MVVYQLSRVFGVALVAGLKLLFCDGDEGAATCLAIASFAADDAHDGALVMVK